jgi:hypothetical protein
VEPVHAKQPGLLKEQPRARWELRFLADSAMPLTEPPQGVFARQRAQSARPVLELAVCVPAP